MSFDGGRGSLGGRSNKLRIDGLHYEVSERELQVRNHDNAASSSLTVRQALFSQIGTITDGPRIKVRLLRRSLGL